MAGFSRRDFLQASAAMAFAGALPAAPREKGSAVVDVRSAAWLGRDGQPEAAVIGRMLGEGMMALTGKDTPEAAWRSLFEPAEMVGLKFNVVSRDYTGANQALCDALAGGLVSAGLKRKNIVVVEAEGVRFDGGERRTGWAGRYDFGSGKTRLSSFLVNQVDAVINVPNLKHHPLAGFTGCLKNISHAGGTLMEGPGRFHGNACNPYIADIYALGPVRSKVRLNVLNGLKGIFDRGAYPPPPQFQWRHDGLLIGKDPVAIDTMGAELVDAARAKARGQAVRRDARALRYLRTAAERGLGTDNRSRIEVAQIRL
jgi:hypothetical protein